MKAKMVYIVAALMLVLSMAAVMVPASPAMAATPWYVATTGSDTGGDGSVGNPWGNISYAISKALIGDTIIVAPGQYNEHDITINKSLAIQGAGAGSTFVDGEDISRVFYINQSTVDMSGMTIRNGNTTGNGGGIYNNIGNVTLTNCTISGNDAEDDGGGIYNAGAWGSLLTMTGCTISGNHATGNGGGVYNASGNVTMTNCTVSGNTAGDDGGGIFITYSWPLNLRNCTVSGNDAAHEGGGIFHNSMSRTVKCTIVYNNTASSYPNFFSIVSIPTDENIVDSPDPLLGPLQDNGGPTETHALMIGSPAIDACTTDCPLPATDQRGQPRPADGDIDGTYFCDVGAYERQVAVGGIVEPVDKIGILAPWLGLAAFLAIAMVVVVLFKRRRIA